MAARSVAASRDIVHCSRRVARRADSGAGALAPNGCPHLGSLVRVGAHEGACGAERRNPGEQGPRTARRAVGLSGD